MQQATIEDLEKELWLRKRNLGLITYTTTNGFKIPIKNLSLEHLENIIQKERNKYISTIEIKAESFNFY